MSVIAMKIKRGDIDDIEVNLTSMISQDKLKIVHILLIGLKPTDEKTKKIRDNVLLYSVCNEKLGAAKAILDNESPLSHFPVTIPLESARSIKMVKMLCSHKKSILDAPSVKRIALHVGTPAKIRSFLLDVYKRKLSCGRKRQMDTRLKVLFT